MERRCESMSEIEGRCERNHEGDEVHPATFRDKEKIRLKLDGLLALLMMTAECMLSKHPA